MANSSHFYDLGQISWLWMSSTLHAKWPTVLMMRNVIPPVKLGQYKILSNGSVPLAYASWAFLSSDAERRYVVDPSMIGLSDWNSGDRMWFIDFISPYSVEYTFKLARELRILFPERHARALRVSLGNDTARVHTFRGDQAPDGWRQKADAEIFGSFLKEGLINLDDEANRNERDAL